MPGTERERTNPRSMRKAVFEERTLLHIYSAHLSNTVDLAFTRFFDGASCLFDDRQFMPQAAGSLEDRISSSLARTNDQHSPQQRPTYGASCLRNKKSTWRDGERRVLGRTEWARVRSDPCGRQQIVMKERTSSLAGWRERTTQHSPQQRPTYGASCLRNKKNMWRDGERRVLGRTERARMRSDPCGRQQVVMKERTLSAIAGENSSSASLTLNSGGQPSLAS
ncbi:hypothetical protein CF326_g3773 [Tilletia indica]|nr:hypothetical protein CF326_g3773 [Tilletia indica]